MSSSRQRRRAPSFTVAPLLDRVMPQPTTTPTTGSPLDEVNASFHEGYDEARAQAELDAPVFVVLTDVLLAFRRGERTELPFTPRAFHVLKSVAHAPIGLFALLRPGAASARPARAALARLREHVASSLASLDDDLAELDDAAVVRDARAVLEPLLVLLDVARDDELAPSALDALANGLGAPLLRVTDHATRVQLAALHERVEEAIARLDDGERRALQVVVVGNHQARARSLAMQYFQKRLREPEGIEERVTYGEGIDDEKAALALVGTRRLDRVIARAFFGNPRRLQRDILGDAAATHLASLELAPIG